LRKELLGWFGVLFEVFKVSFEVFLINI
jgi:hypothetical protein